MTEAFTPAERGEARAGVFEEHSLPRRDASLARRTLSSSLRPRIAVPLTDVSALTGQSRSILAAQASGALPPNPGSSATNAATHLYEQAIGRNINLRANPNPRRPSNSHPVADRIIAAGQRFAGYPRHPYHINHQRRADPNDHCGMVFFQVVDGEVRVQWWRDRNGGMRDNYIVHVYDTDEQDRTAPVQWEPLTLQSLNSVPELADHIGGTILPYWEAREQWMELNPPGAVSFDTLVARMDRWLPEYTRQRNERRRAAQAQAAQAAAQAAAAQAAAAQAAQGWGSSVYGRRY